MRIEMLSLLFAHVLFIIFMFFFLLRRFYAHLRLFLFSFAYVLFMLLMLVRSFFKRYKTPPITSFTILLLVKNKKLELYSPGGICHLCQDKRE